MRTFFKATAAWVCVVVVASLACWLPPETAGAADLPAGVTAQVPVPVPGLPGAAPTSLPAPVPCLPVVGCDPAGHLAGDAAHTAAQAAFDVMGGWIAAGAVTVLTHVADLVTSTTSVHLDSPSGAANWFGRQYGWMRTLALFVVLPMLVAAAISAVIHQDPARLARAVFVHLPLAVLGTAVAVELTARALQLTDILCAQVSASLGGNVRQALDTVARAMSDVAAAGTGAGGFVATIGTLLVAFGALLIWIELLIRASAIYVAVLFLPLALCGLLWPATARWARRMVELLVALIASKFVIVAVISLAAGALANGQGIDAVLAGAALLLTAAFAPFVLLRLVPMVEAGAISHLEGLERRPVAAASGAALRVGGLAMRAFGDEGFSSAAAGFDPATGLSVAAGTALPAPAAAGPDEVGTPATGTASADPVATEAAGAGGRVTAGARPTASPVAGAGPAAGAEVDHSTPETPAEQ